MAYTGRLYSISYPSVPKETRIQTMWLLVQIVHCLSRTLLASSLPCFLTYFFLPLFMSLTFTPYIFSLCLLFMLSSFYITCFFILYFLKFFILLFSYFFSLVTNFIFCTSLLIDNFFLCLFFFLSPFL